MKDPIENPVGNPAKPPKRPAAKTPLQERIRKRKRFGEQTAVRKKRLIAAIIIVITAVILELTLFNRPHYTFLFQGEENSAFEVVTAEDGNPGFRFESLNRRVNSVYVEPATDAPDRALFYVIYSDEGSSRAATSSFTVVKGLEYTYYQEINPYGDVDHLTIVSQDGQYAAGNVAVNKTIPLWFCFERFLLVSLVMLGLYFLVVCDIHKTVFDPKSKWQMAACALVLAGFALLGVWIAHSVYANTDDTYQRFTESLLAGRLDIGVEPPEALLALENP
jgi:hypothetical protein